jgi:hydrogenase maturation factor HypF (carbamoyltransferase family)
MTKYRIVIEFTTPLIDEFIICYVNNLEDVFNFLMKFYDMEPTVVVLDDNHGYDTEKYDF